MPCYAIRHTGADGEPLSGFICGEFGAHCTNCGTVSDVLCDYPVGDGKTCDRAICEACAHETAPDVHYCDGHYAQWRTFVDAGGVRSELENVIAFKGEKAK